MSLIKSIDGTILDLIIKGGTLKVIDGVIYDGLGRDEASTSLSAIGYVNYYTGSVTATLPIYNLSDIPYNALRIYTPYGIGCFKLVALNSPLSSQIRISTSAGTKSVALGI